MVCLPIYNLSKGVMQYASMLLRLGSKYDQATFTNTFNKDLLNTINHNPCLIIHVCGHAILREVTSFDTSPRIVYKNSNLID